VGKHEPRAAYSTSTSHHPQSRAFFLARATRSGCRTAGAAPFPWRGPAEGVCRTAGAAPFPWRGPREAAAAPQVPRLFPGAGLPKASAAPQVPL